LIDAASNLVSYVETLAGIDFRIFWKDSKTLEWMFGI